MANFIQDSFKIDINVLRFFGLYPSNNNSVLVKVKSILAYFVAYVLVTILVFISVLSENDYDNMQMNFIVVWLCESIGFSFKLLPFLINGRRIMECVNYFEQPQFEPTNLEEKKIIDECVWICQRNSKAYFYTIVMSVIVWSIPVLWFKSAKLPINCWLPYDPEDNLFSYYATLICLFSGMC